MAQLLVAVGIGAGTLVTEAGALTLAGSLVNLGAGLAITGLSRLITSTVDNTNAAIGGLISKTLGEAQYARNTLAVPSVNPPYRYVYGRTRAIGTCVAQQVVNDKLYLAYLLNSRPSDLSEFSLFVDKREVSYYGDPFDFSVNNAVSAPELLDGQIWFWVTRGDETAPPVAITNSTTDFISSDAWRGRTVLWMIAYYGDPDLANDRWVSKPPLVEVEGTWSRVWDPRDPAQDPDDPDTWAWSNNHALCELDLRMQYPLRPWPRENILLDWYEQGANECDQRVALAGGGTEPRYCADGTLVFSDDMELEDALAPLTISAASRSVYIGGRVGYVAAVWHPPEHEVTDIIDEAFEMQDMADERDLATDLRVSYIEPGNGYEPAAFKSWPIPGAETEVGPPNIRSLDLSFCASPGQAARVRKISGLRYRRQRTISAVLLPAQMGVVPCSTLTWSLPAPIDMANGIYEVVSAHPGFQPLGEDGGVAARVPVSLVGDGPDTYAWSTTEEEEPIVEPYEGTRLAVQPPGTIAITTGGWANLDSSSETGRVYFEFAPSDSSGVTRYQWQVKETGGDFVSAGIISADARNSSGNVFGYLFGAIGTEYDIEVKTEVGESASSVRTYTGAAPQTTGYLDLPTLNSATAGAGEVTISVTAPAADSDVTGIEVWGASSTSASAAVLIGSTVATSPGDTVSVTETGLTAGVARTYWARTRGAGFAASKFTASATATPT